MGPVRVPGGSGGSRLTRREPAWIAGLTVLVAIVVVALIGVGVISVQPRVRAAWAVQCLVRNECVASRSHEAPRATPQLTLIRFVPLGCGSRGRYAITPLGDCAWSCPARARRSLIELASTNPDTLDLYAEDERPVGHRRVADVVKDCAAEARQSSELERVSASLPWSGDLVGK